MKCPKCGYLGFEPADRCRNCGYDFSLAQKTDADLSLRLEHEPAPATDLSLVHSAAAPPMPTSELPLFGAAIPDDEPLITKPSPPRPPLAVRRATPEHPRHRVVRHTESLALELDDAPPPVAQAARMEADSAGSAAPSSAIDATPGSRLAAAAIDLAVLAAIDAMVIYFTMQICGVGLSELDLLPRVPLGAFLLCQNAWYFVAFTAGGQTLGKMVMRIKVVPAGPIGRALLREALWLVLAVPAGLGFLTILSSDHRGLHDRFAGTRVVR
jgi:uncharacterized RDD family membrane protein YckC